MSQNNYVIECPVFYPTMEDMEGSFEAYISKIEKKFAHIGLARLVPPKGWTARRKGYRGGFDFDIPRPIRQVATGKRGLYRTLLIEHKAMTLRDGFEPAALAEENAPPKDADPETLERKFWQQITMRPPLYGADCPGSLFDKSLKGWNLRKLDSMLSRKLDELDVTLEGVNTPFLYFGMWRSIFAWHTEDMDLHSVNFLHYGAPKSWYCVPPPYRQRFETLLKSLLPDMYRHCPEFVRHKELMISPGMLAQNNIPVVKTQQFPGEFIINYPGAYHSGFNCGYNCAESCNFATKAWLPIGLAARPCVCDRDTVRIQMSIFADVAPPRLRKQLLESDPTTSEESSQEEDSEESSSSSEDEVDTSHASSSRRARGAARPRGRPPKHAASGGRTMAAVAGGRAMVAGGRAMVAGGRSMTAAQTQKPSSSALLQQQKQRKDRRQHDAQVARAARASARASAQAAAEAAKSRAKRAAARAAAAARPARHAARAGSADSSADEHPVAPITGRRGMAAKHAAPSTSSEHSSGSHHTNVSLPHGRPVRRAARGHHQHAEEATSPAGRTGAVRKRKADDVDAATPVRTSRRMKASGIAKRLRAMLSML